VAQVLQVAPQVKPGTFVVLTNVPSANDAFGDNMWFDMALRLAYPTVSVAGVYYLDQGKVPPGSPLKLVSGEWHQTGVGHPTLFSQGTISETIIVECHPDESPKLLENVPDFLGGRELNSVYEPKSRIVSMSPSEIAVTRYGPIKPRTH